ncbi:unnamed protein product [Adineta steineri]|uniref:Galactosylceramide sulfotransferase-like n=1 Tax=Adineta steineri TaxID=433720 RepID=A0A819XUS7_9BILA|nr:unnamed protein product [Adineta steineri]
MSIDTSCSSGHSKVKIRRNVVFKLSTKVKSDRPVKLLTKKNCKPQQNILFLKTHKTGSSTVQNIFLRYGDNNNLTLVIPEKSNYFGYPRHFNRRMLHSKYRQNSSKIQNNIFAHHARYHYKEMKSIMPRNTIFITILRDPVVLIESLFSYYNLKKIYNETSSISFLKNAFSTSLNISAYHATSSQRFLGRFGRNQMSFDLGFSVENFDNLKMIREFIEAIDSQFHLVMIADRMDESLILLQHTLCWKMEDVIVFRHNARRTSEFTSLPKDLQENIRIFSIADVLLYNYFSDKLNRLIEKFGKRRMKMEIAALQNATKSIYRQCVHKEPFKDMIVYYNKNQTIDKKCQDFIISELSYTDLLREEQNKRYRFI